MSPRRTRAATAEQSAVSRAKARRISNVTQDMDKSAQKIRQSQKKKSVKNNLKATVKQSSRKESPNADVTIKKSMKKKTSRRKLNLNNEEETEGVDQTIDLNESVRILRGRNNDNVSTMGFVKHNLLQLSASKNLDLEKMPNGKLQRKTTSKLSPIIVTPKNTPPKLSLTPHRSNKTPKKSPISLDSPKTHSIAVPKLFKSPRKLSLTSTDKNSEENREKKSDSDSHAKKSRKKDSPSNNSPSDKNASGSPPRKKHNSKVFVPKFSKSPKIVLKSPKSNKSKSRKLKSPLSPVQKRKNMLKTSTNSPTTPNLNSDNSSRIRIKISPLFKGKNLSSIKHCLLNSELTKTLTASQIEDVLGEPIVLLEKLSPKSLKQRSMVRSSSIRARNSKVLTPTKKASVGMSSKRNSNPKLRNNSMEKLHVSNTNRISPRIKYNTSIEEKDKSSTPLMSSTPRKERMTLMDTSLTSNTSIASVNNTSLNIKLRHRNQSNMQLFNIMSNNTDIENVSKASLFDKEINGTSPSRFSHVTKQDTTYEKDNTMEKKQENNRNNTYDLEEPQILNSRQMIKKRTSTDVNLSLRDSAKKTKVRFANVISSRDNRDTQKSINKLNGSRSSISHNVNAQNRSNIMNSAHKSKKVQTPKSTRSSINSPFKRSSPRFHGGTPRVHLNRIQITPKIFTSVEKKSEKKSSTKKVPNFERIHQQMFAKAESLVDVKKRLQARHLAFTTNKVGSKANVKTEEKKPLPTETRDGVHNRFGFKLKKTEATHIILKKQAVFSREKQQHEMRMTLKGIRTNRRFELLMKSRNLKS